MRLRIRYIIGCVFWFSVILKPKRLVFLVFSSIISSRLLLAFAVSVVSMSKNTYFTQQNFNIIPFTYNSNIVRCFINRNKKRPFWIDLRQVMTSICFRIGLDLDQLILVLSFETFLSTLFNMISKVLKIPQILFHQKTAFL